MLKVGIAQNQPRTVTILGIPAASIEFPYPSLPLQGAGRARQPNSNEHEIHVPTITLQGAGCARQPS